MLRCAEISKKDCDPGLAWGLGFLQQGTEGVHGNAESASGESVHVGGIDSDDFASGVEYGSTTAAVGGGRVVDELVADDVAKMSAGGGGTNQGEGCQLAGRVEVIVAVGEALVDSSWGLGNHAGNPHGIADHGDQLPRSTGGLCQGQCSKTADNVGTLST